MQTLSLLPITRHGRYKPSLLKGLLAGLGLALSQLSVAADIPAHKQPTLRALSQVTPVSSLEPKSTALLVIDFQNEYFTGKLPIPDGMRALENTQRLLAFADRAGFPVIHIQHVAPEGSAVFALGSEGVDFHPLMKPRSKDRSLPKTTVSAFASTDLDSQLKEAGIKTLIVAGLMTHACVAGAARDAAPLGYNVIVASDASATRAITRADGHSVSAQQLHESSLASIEDTFGDVLTTQGIIDLKLK